MTGAIEKKLESYFQSKIPEAENLKIKNFKQPSSGWSDISYIFDVCGATFHKGFAIRKQNKGGLMHDTKNLYQQYQVLKTLSQHEDIPVPKVYWFEPDESIIGGAFFVMEKLEGKTIVPWSKEGQQFLKNAYENGNIPRQFTEFLAKLHLLDVKEAVFTNLYEEPKGAYNFINNKLKELEELYHRYLIAPDPIMVDAFEWLKWNKPAAQRYSIIHNDYRTGNLLYQKNEITGILDWESAEIGDPMADVAYVCAKANRMDSPLMCYLLEKQKFLEAYSELTGLDVDEKVLHYYGVYHQVRFVLISQSAAASFSNGQTRDLRLARQGYRWPLMRGMVADLLGY